MLFADDWLALSAELEDLAGIHLVMTFLCHPFNWKKFRGGGFVSWVGYEINCSSFPVGISLVRAQWLIGLVSRTLEVGTVDIDDLVAALGNMLLCGGTFRLCFDH